MARAKTIDRLEYTKNRSIHFQDVPVREVEGRYDEEKGVIVIYDKPKTESQGSAGFIVCPVCGEKLIHESDCLRCTCGWSKC